MYVRRTYTNPYRSTRRTYAPSRATYRERVATNKKKAVSKARSVKTVAARKRTIKRNTAAIRKLRNELYGPVQRSITYNSATFNIHRDHPALFCVTTPDHGHAHGPRIMSLDATTGNLSSLTHFEQYLGEGYSRGDYVDDDAHHIANGPKLKLLTVDLAFNVHGYVHDTRVRIDIIRCKKMVHAFWKDEQAKQYLPYTLPALKRITGHTPNEIPRKDMEILATRYVYLNSEEFTTFTDAAVGEEETNPPSTPGSRRCRIYLKLNKVIKQLDHSTDEDTGAEISIDAGSNVFGSGGGYQYNNVHPLANIWCLMSTDSSLNWSGLIDAKHNVNIDIVRKLAWRDHIA